MLKTGNVDSTWTDYRSYIGVETTPIGKSERSLWENSIGVAIHY